MKDKAKYHIHDSLKILSKIDKNWVSLKKHLSCNFDILNGHLSIQNFYHFQPQPRQMKMSHFSVVSIHSCYPYPSFQSRGHMTDIQKQVKKALFWATQTLYGSSQRLVGVPKVHCDVSEQMTTSLLEYWMSRVTIYIVI